MKTKSTLIIIVLLGLLFTSCSKEEGQKEEEVTIDLVNDEFPEAEEEVIETFVAMAQSIKDGDIEKLISYHAYSPKFTEFKNGEPRNDAATNEAYERELFGSVTEVVAFNANDLQVANVTFHSDFQLKFGDDLVVVNDQITLLFVNTSDGWKMVHEHHSHLN